ncbi:MAG: hypothetical protein ACJ73D_01415 [Pyrinomonadaceae bacterium]
MKNALLSSIAILVLVIAEFGQHGSTSQNASGNASANAGRNSGDLSLAEGTHIDGELQKTLDVRNARPGDQVLLKTTKDIKQNGHTVIQKGSTLVGRVTDVSQRSKQNSQSRLGILFDRVQGHGLDMPITASIVSITNAAANANVGDLGDADLMGSSSTSGGMYSGRSGGSRSSGGLLGGVGNTVGGVTNGVTSAAGGVVNTTGQTVGGVTNTAGRNVGSTVGGVSSGVSGISILNSGSTNASAGNGSTLASSTQNVRVEKGSMIGLQLDNSASASASRGH